LKNNNAEGVIKGHNRAGGGKSGLDTIDVGGKITKSQVKRKDADARILEMSQKEKKKQY